MQNSGLWKMLRVSLLKGNRNHQELNIFKSLHLLFPLYLYSLSGCYKMEPKYINKTLVML